ncbi:MAG TPA: WbqC family protein, partial [Rhizomicrobium sp.]|nr:WbqC family protein [Rhizomicrobium sp.]
MSHSAVIHQPDFLPWLGYFHRLLEADLFIALDHVQFVTGTSRSWTHRDVIKTPQGAKWLSLRVQKAPFGISIRDVQLAPGREWRQDNLNLIRESYRKAPHFAEVFPRLEELYTQPIENMAEMNLASLDLLEDMLDVKTPRLISSQMSPQGSSTAMLVDLLRKAGATRYISGQGARAYLDESLFAKAGIELVWQAFHHPVYPQLHGPFLPMLSSVDAL